MSEARKPRQAATVILLRPAPPEGFEVFLTRRPDAMPFLGGMYCYPGGTISREDYAPAILQRCHGLTPQQAQKIIGAQFSPKEALGLWVAAVRAVFEEVGVLFAVESSGERLAPAPKRAHRIAEKHGLMLGKSLSFVALLESEGLRCDLSGLAYFSYWQTPAQFSMRFDTRFFVAALPEGQTPLSTSYEVAQSVWLTPDRAMQLFNRGELPMIFPTFASLRTLADFETIESVFKEFRSSHSITP
jgi:8-oxo-dGTP pyrophosphatase MutT (NUDIX family)